MKINYHYSVNPLIENYSGDAVFVKAYDDYLFFSVIDVLGHGEAAAVSSKIILDFLEQNFNKSFNEIIIGLHKLLNKKRGALFTLCRINKINKELEYVTIGNITLIVSGAGYKNFVGTQGIVGSVLPSIRVERYALQKNDVIFVYTDGISSKFDTKNKDFLNEKTEKIVEIIMTQYGKKYDDKACLVLKIS